MRLVALIAAPDAIAAIRAWQSWLAHERRCSENTLLSYSRTLAAFLEYLAERRDEAPSLEALGALTYADFRSYLVQRSNRLSAASRAHIVSTLRNFFRFLTRRGFIADSAVFVMRSPKLPKVLPKAMTVDDALEAIEVAGQLAMTKWQGLRDVAILMLLYGCGLRISEALSLKRRDAPLSAGVLTVTGKGNKQRMVPVLAAVAEAVRRYIKACPYRLRPDRPLFRSNRGSVQKARTVQAMIKRVRDVLELPDTVTPHAFRHSFATHLLDQDADLMAIRDARYTAVSSARMLAVYDKAHPRANGTSARVDLPGDAAEEPFRGPGN